MSRRRRWTYAVALVVVTFVANMQLTGLLLDAAWPLWAAWIPASAVGWFVGSRAGFWLGWRSVVWSECNEDCNHDQA